MKAHDVRHLCICTSCGKIGDDREMIAIGGDRAHGCCVFDVLGMSAVLRLPVEELKKFSIDDLGGFGGDGVQNMKRLCQRLDALEPSCMTFD